jgi:hypothetical protein
MLWSIKIGMGTFGIRNRLRCREDIGDRHYCRVKGHLRRRQHAG